MNDYLMFVSKITEMTGITNAKILEVYRQAQLTEHEDVCQLFMDKFQLSYGFANTLADLVKTAEESDI